MPNSYPHDGILNQHLTAIKDSYIPIPGVTVTNYPHHEKEDSPGCHDVLRGGKMYISDAVPSATASLDLYFTDGLLYVLGHSTGLLVNFR